MMPISLRSVNAASRAVLPFAAAIVFASGASAAGRDWPDAGGWTIGEVSDGCAMALEFEGKGDTELVAFLNTDGGVMLMIQNRNWTIQKDLKFEAVWQLDGELYSGDAVGLGGSGGKKGFVSKFGSAILPDLAKASSLRVYRGTVLVDQLSLAGSAAGVAMARRCVAAMQVREAAAAREKARFNHLPDDPFADDPRPLPKIDPAWITNDDYPPASLRNGEQGQTALEFTISLSGRIEGCTVKVSSGYSALDRASCSAITRRGRFDPSVYRLPATVRHTVRWRLPPEEPAAPPGSNPLWRPAR